MAHAGASPSWVTLELTESLLMHNSAAALEQLHAIRGLAFMLPSTTLGPDTRRWPTWSVSRYHSDRPVVRDSAGRSASGAGVVRAIVEIGRGLGLTTVAEGSETPPSSGGSRSSVACSARLLFSRPLERTRWLTSSRARPTVFAASRCGDPGRSVGRRRPPPPGGAGRAADAIGRVDGCRVERCAPPA